uniref:Uncharacterized protein n=1 Tax=Candidatus Kentrum sp. TC TaxID=2126339 RepID=A0A451ABC3_9GAMM|nr:MAG: hypothetical protein BECKTC1821F_GA0114240_10927 [Candidatus Kentron sp. TC]
MSKNFLNREISIFNHSDTSDLQKPNFFSFGYTGLGVSWDTIKDIQVHYLERHFNKPGSTKLRRELPLIKSTLFPRPRSE